jgi:long-chain acyl-CoA synthetase
MAQPVDVADLAVAAAAAAPDRVAVEEADGGRSLTWGALDDEVSRLATGLASQGVVAGRRVLLALGNRLELVASWLGVLRAQAVAVPVDPRWSAAELARAVADSGAALVVGDATTLPRLREAAGLVGRALDGDPGDLDPDVVARATRPVVVALDEPPADGEVAYADLCAVEPRPVPPLRDPERLAALLYTGGTTGPPRAAMLTHRALLANVEQVASVSPPMVDEDDVVLGVLPLFHVYGLNAVLGSVLRSRARLVLVASFDAVGTLDVVADRAITVVPVAPPVVEQWLRVPGLADRLAGVRLVVSGSATLPAEAAEAFADATGIVVHQGYGLTEAAPVVTSTLRSDRPRPGTLGRELAGVLLRLVDDRGRAVEDGDPGEVQLHGDNLFSGYWPDGVDGPGADGWWSTGDVALRDDHGDLVLVDRLDEVVVVSGFRVYPREVEAALEELPEVAEAAVIGVADPDSGEAVVAYVVAAADVAGEAVVAAVHDRAAATLAPFKRPQRVEVVSTLPLTVTGRVRKGRLRGLERRRAGGLVR